MLFHGLSMQMYTVHVDSHTNLHLYTLIHIHTYQNSYQNKNTLCIDCKMLHVNAMQFFRGGNSICRNHSGRTMPSECLKGGCKHFGHLYFTIIFVLNLDSKDRLPSTYKLLKVFMTMVELFSIFHLKIFK